MRRFVTVFLTIALICSTVLSNSACANKTKTAFLTEERPDKSNYEIKEEKLFEFVKENFIGINGEIFTNTKRGNNNMDTLSESIGLLLNYCVMSNDRELFDRELAYLKKNMLADGYFVRWRTGADKANCNALVDDLRIVRALMDAYAKWQDKSYMDTAALIQQAVYEKQVKEGRIFEFYDWKSGKARNSIPLCYIDLYTMDKASIFNEGWGAAINKGLGIMNKGRINGESPLFYKYYSYENGKYSLDEEVSPDRGVCLTYTLYTAMHLAEMKEDTSFFTGWLKKELEGGKLYAWYNPKTLKPSQTMESTAVYALAAIYSKKAGEDELCRSLVDKMLKLRVDNHGSPYYGGFGDESSGNFYSFDNLTALWALAEMNKK